MMKKILALMLLFANLFVNAQQTITDSIYYDGIYRNYILYVPASYNSSFSVPLVLNFHGYTSNSTAQMYYGDFRTIADTANFLVVHPMGTLDGSNQPYWNADWGGTVDDIGFTAALIDSLSLEYNINQERVYSTGMSNGGFMSYTLACSLSNRIAAIASVTGSMNITQTFNCNPQHSTPVMEIHGTADATVPYNGSAGVEPIADVLSYWVGFNNCNTTAIFNNVPNINTTDGCTAEHYVYQNGNNGVEVEHYKIINGGHTWPGAPVVTGTTNYDFNASEKIWQFFAKYDINGKINSTDINKIEPNQTFNLYPNPTNGQLNILSDTKIEKLEIFDINGRILREFNNSSSIVISELENGIYWLKVYSEGKNEVKKIIKN